MPILKCFSDNILRYGRRVELMTIGNDEYAKRALDFVERLQPLEDYDEICRLIEKELEWFGFECVSSWSFPGPGEDPDECLLMNNRPQEYVERYIENNYVFRDPVVTEIRRTLSPFSWGDVRSQRELDKTELSIMEEGREFGASDGLIIPIVTLSGSVALFSPCGRDPNLSQRARSATEVIGIYAYHALRRALLRSQREAAVHTPLTPREREVMQWVAAGKTDDEIGEILSIGAATATRHVENAKRKLDSFKRTYAVVQAIRYGEISP